MAHEPGGQRIPNALRPDFWKAANKEPGSCLICELWLLSSSTQIILSGLGSTAS